MISRDVIDGLFERLNYVGGVADPEAMPAGFAFDVDYDSSVVWPDLPYDTASAQSHYDRESRRLVLPTLEAAANLFRVGAPKAWMFVNEELDRAMLRRSEAVAGASSSSNRALVGVCLLTNLHVAPDGVSVCVEALVHEAIHQHLYRMELRHGNICDLGDTGRYRSPWSGNRIPLHSLVHASLVWFGLLSLWCQLRQSSPDRADAGDLQGRVASTLLGFAYIRQIMESPGFPRNGVHPHIVDMINYIGNIADLAGGAAHGRGKLGDSLRASENGAWVTDLSSALRHIHGGWKQHASMAQGPAPTPIGAAPASEPRPQTSH